MSLPFEKFITHNFWNFSITKDSENPILLEFQISNGETKATPPSFLMAYLLKQQIKAIEKAINERPRKIAIWVIDNYKKEEHQRIEKQYKESCNTLSNAKPKYQFECQFPFIK